ncbi:hypothetical protein SDC9_74594 [bioreactor metagenome]|uniref:NAD-specific glutamate dehydrogenase n=1 Tax=bioreactor metagenome TaxID=1076179 RepID=A0A644YIF5_9ZZZZ
MVLVNQLLVGTVVDRGLQRLLQGVAQLGVVLGDGHAERAGDHLLADDLELPLRLQGVVDRDRVLLDACDRAALLDLEHRLRLAVEGHHGDLALARLLTVRRQPGGDVVLLGGAALQGDRPAAQVVDGRQALGVARSDVHDRAGEVVVHEVDLLLALLGVAHRGDGRVEAVGLELGDQPVEGGVVEDHRNAQFGPQQVPELLVEPDHRLAVGVVVLHRRIGDVAADLDRPLVLDRLRQRGVQRRRGVDPRRGGRRGRGRPAATAAGRQGRDRDQGDDRGEDVAGDLHGRSFRIIEWVSARR